MYLKLIFMWTSGLTGFHGELKKGRHHHDHHVISSLLCPHRGIFESEVWWDVEFDGCHCPWHRDPIEAHRPVVKPLPDARALHLVLRIRRSGGLHHDHPTSECEEGLGWGISGKSGNSMERWDGADGCLKHGYWPTTDRHMNRFNHHIYHLVWLKQHFP